jgi:GNAT superfamily N-acetyltransferase
MRLIPADAVSGDVAELTAVAHAAKRVWGYPEEWISLWSDELTVRPGYLDEHRVRVVRKREIFGWCATRADDEGVAWLEACWVRPASTGRGIGRLLVGDAFRIARQLGATEMRVVADPNAAGFYERLGFRRIGDEPSLPAGRRLPILARALDSEHRSPNDRPD